MIDNDIITIKTNDGHFERCRWLIENAKKYQPIIDIGCSDGFMFRDIDLDVTETDIKYYFPPEYEGKIKFIEADASNLPCKNKEFGCAVLGDMLEHVKDPVAVIKESIRIANIVFISVPNEWEWDKEQRPFTHADHVRFYNQHTFEHDINLAIENNTYELYKINGGGWSFYCAKIQ